MKRLAISWTIVLVAAVALVTGAQAKSTHRSAVNVNISYSGVDAETLPAFVAQDAGLTAKKGLNVNFEVLNSTAGIAALLNGQVQIANIGGSEVLDADANGSNLVVVANYAPVSAYELWVPGSITSAAQLKGKKIGISRVGSTSYVATLEALIALHLDTKDVSIISLGSHSARTAAALSGQISAAVDYPPGSLQLKAAGWHPLVNLAKVGQKSEGEDVVVTSSYLQSHRAVVQKYVDSIVQADRIIAKNESLSVHVLEHYFNSTNTPQFQATWKALKSIFPAYPYPRVTQYHNAIKYGKATVPALATLNVANYLNTSFVASAQKRALGGLTKAAFRKEVRIAKRAENTRIRNCRSSKKKNTKALHKCVARAKHIYAKQHRKLKKQEIAG